MANSKRAVFAANTTRWRSNPRSIIGFSVRRNAWITNAMIITIPTTVGTNTLGAVAVPYSGSFDSA